MTPEELWRLFQESMYPWATVEDNIKSFTKQLLKRLKDDTRRSSHSRSNLG